MELSKVLKNNIRFGAHIDTGINRLGINFKSLPQSIFKSNKILVVMSHLSSADEKKNNYNNKYLFKPFLNNYSQLIAQKLSCIDGEDNYDLILNQNLYNFEDTILNLNDKADNLRCNALTLFNKFENKEIISNVVHLRSDHFFEIYSLS